ncbi:hypothetical protein Lsed01_01316 [Demequina sediminis]|uniref:Histidine kinase/HSP90-like ATPase domain-containing protein n=1 Tax=Demequina sediminis TaxID=1930058 RepID=A0ABP9WGE3_9MICO|nr:ATP-binding protein [Demequina sediminis]BDZ61520.1 hypothetical protein GCM10025873_13110 [Demequina sediminis]
MSRSEGGGRSALERMQRTTYFATGLAAALFTVLLSPGPNGALAQMDQLRAPFGLYTVVVGAAIPASYAVLAFVVSIRTMRVLVTACAAGFVLAQLLWIPAMTGEVLADGAAPWLQGYGAIHATMLAVAWNRPAVWVFPVMQWPLVATVEYLASGGNLEQSVLDGMGAMVTSLVLAGAGAGVVTAAARQDLEAERARAQAAHEASLRTGEREQARINALVHDDIMSVLLAAVRTPVSAGAAAGSLAPSPAVSEQARKALSAVAAIRGSRSREAPYPPHELEAVLRVTANEVSEDIVMSSRVSTDAPVPAAVVAALAEATGEALRNSVIHAGGPDDAVVRSLDVAIRDGEVWVSVSDDGRGFTPKTVPARRLGLAVSIHGRMNALPGGGARVTSAPGAGTTVELWWRAEDGR